MKKLLLSLIALALGATTIALSPTADAGGPSSTFGHWPGSGDRDIPIVNSTTLAWQEAFDHAVSVWSVSSKLNLEPEPGSTTKRQREKCKLIPGAIRVCSYPYGRQKGWAGIMIPYFSSGRHLAAVRVKLNQSFVKPGSNFDTHLICHEVGHAIGLEHRDPPLTGTATHCLTPILNDGDDTPDATDFTNLTNEYHDDALLRSATGGGDLVRGDPIKIYPRR